MSNGSPRSSLSDLSSDGGNDNDEMTSNPSPRNSAEPISAQDQSAQDHSDASSSMPSTSRGSNGFFIRPDEMMSEMSSSSIQPPSLVDAARLTPGMYGDFPPDPYGYAGVSDATTTFTRSTAFEDQKPYESDVQEIMRQFGPTEKELLDWLVHPENHSLFGQVNVAVGADDVAVMLAEAGANTFYHLKTLDQEGKRVTSVSALVSEVRLMELKSRVLLYLDSVESGLFNAAANPVVVTRGIAERIFAEVDSGENTLVYLEYLDRMGRQFSSVDNLIDAMLDVQAQDMRDRRKVQSFMDDTDLVKLMDPLRPLTDREVDRMFEQAMAGSSTLHHLWAFNQEKFVFQHLDDLLSAIRERHRWSLQYRKQALDYLAFKSQLLNDDLQLTPQLVDELFDDVKCDAQLLEILKRLSKAKVTYEHFHMLVSAVKVAHFELEADKTKVRDYLLGEHNVIIDHEADVTPDDVEMLLTHAPPGTLTFPLLEELERQRVCYPSVDQFLVDLKDAHLKIYDNKGTDSSVIVACMAILTAKQAVLDFLTRDPERLQRLLHEDYNVDIEHVHRIFQEAKTGHDTLNYLTMLDQGQQRFRNVTEIIPALALLDELMADYVEEKREKAMRQRERDYDRDMRIRDGEQVSESEESEDDAPSTDSLPVKVDPENAYMTEATKAEVLRFLGTSDLLKGSELPKDVAEAQIRNYWHGAWNLGFLRGLDREGKNFDNVSQLTVFARNHYKSLLQHGLLDSLQDISAGIGWNDLTKEEKEEAEKLLAEYLEFDITLQNLGNAPGQVGHAQPFVEIFRQRSHIWEKVLRTPRHKRETNPIFPHIVLLTTNMCMGQALRPILIKVFKVTGRKWAKPDCIGEATVTMHDILDNMTHIPLIDKGRRKRVAHNLIYMARKEVQANNGYLSFNRSHRCALTTQAAVRSPDPFPFLPETRSLLRLNLKAVDLPRMDVGGLSDPYVQFFRLEGTVWELAHTTEVVKQDLNPVWDTFVVPMESLCGDDGNIDVPILVKCYDWDRSSQDDLIGFFQVSLRSILSRPGKKFRLQRTATEQVELEADVDEAPETYIKISLMGKKIDKTSLLGGSPSPWLEIHRRREGVWEKVCQTEAAPNTTAPVWEPMLVKLAELESDEAPVNMSPLKLVCFHKGRTLTKVGELHLTLEDLINAAEGDVYELLNPELTHKAEKAGEVDSRGAGAIYLNLTESRQCYPSAVTAWLLKRQREKETANGSIIFQTARLFTPFPDINREIEAILDDPDSELNEQNFPYIGRAKQAAFLDYLTRGCELFGLLGSNMAEVAFSPGGNWRGGSNAENAFSMGIDSPRAIFAVSPGMRDTRKVQQQQAKLAMMAPAILGWERYQLTNQWFLVEAWGLHLGVGARRRFKLEVFRFRNRQWHKLYESEAGLKARWAQFQLKVKHCLTDVKDPMSPSPMLLRVFAKSPGKDPELRGNLRLTLKRLRTQCDQQQVVLKLPVDAPSAAHLNYKNLVAKHAGKKPAIWFRQVCNIIIPPKITDADALGSTLGAGAGVGKEQKVGV